ncbi:MAG: hypothetical protein ACXWKC_16000 [Xanthobacteraceae bacterium]
MSEDLRKIPLTLGFANLSGDDLSPLVTEDVEALSPLFINTRVVPAHQLPGAHVLFVYTHLNDDGTIRGNNKSGIRQIVQLTNASILVIASPNSADSLKNSAALDGPKTANLIFTLDRNKGGFSKFFRMLFEKMRDGEEMLMAWVEIAPQGPNMGPSDAPSTILLPEAGKLKFPK